MVMRCTIETGRLSATSRWSLQKWLQNKISAKPKTSADHQMAPKKSSNAGVCNICCIVRQAASFPVFNRMGGLARTSVHFLCAQLSHDRGVLAPAIP